MTLMTPRTLPGFMELLPKEQLVFNRLMDIIRTTYESYGFTPLDTPVLEFSEVLLAKAGGETEKQIYAFQKGDNELAMRFDLTVPLAKYVAKNHADLTFPFRRYQIGKVYRGERPQKGRFREFYQCDIDIIGHDKLGLLYDAEMPAVIYTTFRKMGLPKFTIYLNNRKVLSGLFEELGVTEKVADILRIVDKIAKIGEDAVREELEKLELSSEKINTLLDFIKTKGSVDAVLSKLEGMPFTSEVFRLGVSDLRAVTEALKAQGVDENYYKIDLSIVRGLDYYTGTIYETLLDETAGVGSICSGGRYDDLASFYTTQKFPGVGISIGLSRLFHILSEMGHFEVGASVPTDVLVLPMGEEERLFALSFASSLREQGLKAEVMLADGKFKTKMNYANKIGVPYVAIVGSDEVACQKVALKNMVSGEQISATVEQTVETVKENR
ncbi:MAG: histidine--tRNA ligase [Alphaproteobacteria bacterium]|nr:histidine--tRNA ligase [Alphaproteobacteria bacterium]